MGGGVGGGKKRGWSEGRREGGGGVGGGKKRGWRGE